jgi:hypothetical protein
MAQPHPIFDDIDDSNLAEVQQRVLADAAVLEERGDWDRKTPLIYAVDHSQPAIALWLIRHRGQHDVDTTDIYGCTALHYSCIHGPLSIVQALVGAGANPAALNNGRWTPLMYAAPNYHRDIVAFLLRLPAVKASIDHINQHQRTALSRASYWGYQSIVQRLLDAGADPTIPAGPNSPLTRAVSQGNYAIAALLRHAIAEPDRARALHKARALIDAPAIITKARKDAADKGESPAMQQEKALAAAPEWSKGRMAEGRDLPRAELTPQQQQQQQQQQYNSERLRATAAFALGLERGEEGKGMPDDVFVDLLGYLLPVWADKGPEA